LSLANETHLLIFAVFKSLYIDTSFSISALAVIHLFCDYYMNILVILCLISSFDIFCSY